MEPTRLGEPSPPGALDALARDDSSRKRFLRMAGGSAVAAGLSAALAACGSSKSNKTQALGPLAQFGTGDAAVANYALSLEQLEVQFYSAAIGSGKLSAKNAALFKRLSAEEQQHVGALTAMVKKLGGKPVQPQKATFPGGSEASVLSTASTLENLGAGAYLGQLERIQSKELLALVLSIHTVEGRHAASIERVLGHSVTPDGAFALPVRAGDVQTQIQTYLG
ncbi:MAG: ferritin-like domain-containing protein [Thermoleophilaceae bacterium]